MVCSHGCGRQTNIHAYIHRHTHLLRNHIFLKKPGEHAPEHKTKRLISQLAIATSRVGVSLKHKNGKQMEL